MDKGVFIALEGTDGSGKTTQFKLLKEKLEKQGYDVEVFDFPQYDKPSSFFVREYLNGKYGSLDEVGPYTASLFFALDRYEAAPKIKQALSEGKVILTNRFTGSNMAHQGASFDSLEQLRGFFLWLDQIEFELFKIPRPDISIVLRVPAEIAQKMVDQKKSREYTEKKRDLHEADLNHLKRSVQVYDTLCQLFPKDFKLIDCAREGKVLEVGKVESMVWETVKAFLPVSGNLKKKISQTAKSENPYLSKTDGNLEITEEGKKYLEKYITNLNSNVYSFNNELSPQTIAAAMARLSRRSDSLKITLLDEFADSQHKDEKLIQRVLTAYGDDSVQQLLGQHLVLEGISNLMTKKVERSRLAAYLEQSTRYIYFDKKDASGNYPFYIPANFSNQTTKYYVEAMNKLFDNYSRIVHGLTDYIRKHSEVGEPEKDSAWLAATKAQACDAARHALPVALKSTLGIFASAQTIEGLIIRLLSDNLAESRDIGRKILDEARKVYPAFYEKADMQNRGLQNIAYKASTKNKSALLADKYLSRRYGAGDQLVELTDFWPKNELDIVADILYENSSLSLFEIRQNIERWTLDKRRGVIETYIGERTNRRHKPGRAFEKIHYSFDLLTDYGVFRDLQRHRIVDDLEWQKLSPRYGFGIPKIIEEAGYSEIFESSFDLSLKLYSRLQEDGLDQEAQYATLLGHKVRWKLTINAREAFHLLELRTGPQGHPGYRKLCQQMYAKIAETHPLIAESMNFVNNSTDEQLTRLNSELKSNKKLRQIK
ncbi:FAD-dependent thymidylate synthase [Candidatus Parcubacteria bacterium]|nr:FAD-dependent thymidylate synthase [Candidatus Parcubacteria bacterium]